MIRIYFRRICFLLVALALVFGLPLPMDGMQSVLTMQQSALAATAGGPACDDCKCCGEESALDTSACLMLCVGTMAPLPEVKVFDVTESIMLFAGAGHCLAGLSTAPDPSPPRLPHLT